MTMSVEARRVKSEVNSHAPAPGGIARLQEPRVSRYLEAASKSKEKTPGDGTIDWLRPVSDSGVLGVLGACHNHKSRRQLLEFVKVTHVS
jgi:hypothetical protein